MSCKPAQIQIQEAVYSLRHYRQRLGSRPATPARSRAASRSHPLRCAQVSGHAGRRCRSCWPSASERLDRIGGSEGKEGLEKRENEARNVYFGVGTQARAKSANAQPRRLSDKVTEAMQTLAMAGGRFEAALQPLRRGQRARARANRIPSRLARRRQRCVRSPKSHPAASSRG